ncbi:MAG: hypothetical protein ABR973_04090 [Candidatus Acidiferrales bacterium]
MKSLRGQSRVVFWLSICCAAVLLTSCQEQINYPAPTLTSILPASIEAGQPAFILNVNGGNFTPASQVLWNGSQRVTLFTSAGALTAQILASDVQNAGVALVTVSTPQPGGGTTQPQQFTINPAPSPAPQITSLSPSGVSAGSAGFTLTVTGKNFVSESTVTVNGSNRTTNFVGTTSLEVAISAADVVAAGTLQIVVVNPPPSGGASGAFPLNVTNPVPSISSLSPTSATAGAASTALSLTGTGYVPNSVVTINGSPRSTTFGGSTALQATLTTADLAEGGISQVQVVNPSPGGGTSNTQTFAVNPTDAAGLPVLVDIAPSGAQANNGICGTCSGGTPTLATAGPSVSTTGEFVVFASDSTNLLSTLTQPNLTNGESNIFLRNTCLGATSSSCSAPTTSLVSTAANGGAADGPSSEPSIDSGGTDVAFTSTASNLVNYVAVSGSTRQVYWQTPCTGTASCTATNAPVLVSLSADGTSAGNGDSYNPMISPDGQYVAFVSLATNLVSGLTVDGVTPQVYIRTICAGVTPLTQSPACVPTTFLVSSPDGVTPANGASSHPAIANTGLFVSFVSTATNLGATAPNPSAAQEVFETSTCVTGVSGCTEVTTLISSPDGVTAANGASVEPAISADGRFIAFASTATNLVIGVGPTQQIYVRDTCNEVSTLITSCTPSTNLVSSPDTITTPATPANSLSENPSLSECGTSTSTSTCQVGLLIAFATKATNLSSSVQNGVENIFVRSTCQDLATTTTACTPRTVLASQPAGTSATASNGDSIVPAISGDGHTVAFISSATNLVTNDTNGFADVFLGVTSF